MTEFAPISASADAAGEDDAGVTVIEGCYCHACGESDGVTRIMMTMIPYFREVLISSFECGCDECGWKNNEVQFGGELQPRGCRYALELVERADLDRQLIKSDTAAVCSGDMDAGVGAWMSFCSLTP